MDQRLVDAWMNGGRERFAAWAARAHPADYTAVVKAVVEALDCGMDPDRVQAVDWGHYQGTTVFVIGEVGYQPSRFWAAVVGYGSCSGCDTLERVRGYESDRPTEQQVRDYTTLGLHIVQGLRELQEEWVA